jgi:membrane associated rhomboid family serine protease
MSYTLIIILITTLVSLASFNNDHLMQKLIFWPRLMDRPEEYYRLLTSGFIHADMVHLIFNMITLYFFGEYVEQLFMMVGIRHEMFLVLYLTAIIASSMPSYFKQKHNSYYRSLGASGGVAAVLFAFIFFAPWQTISIWFIPVPGIIAGGGYLAYSAYMAKRGGDFINHDAHFAGAIYGFLFLVAFEPNHGLTFLTQLLHPHF